MKHLQLFALLFLSTFCYAQSSTDFGFTEHPTAYLSKYIYKSIDSIKSELLSNPENTLVSFNDGVLIVKSSHNGFNSTTVLKSNKLTGVVFSYDKILHGHKQLNDVVGFYNNFVNKVVEGSWFKPYDQNTNTDLGDIYSKWLFDNGMLMLKINHKNEFIIHSERVYDKDMENLVNSLMTRQ